MVALAVSGTQLRRLVDGLAGLYRPDGGFAARAVQLVSALIGADSCSYNQFGEQGLLCVYREPAGGYPCADAIRAFQQHLPDHPILAYQRATGSARPHRISDFLSDREFRALGLYCDYYRYTGTNYQLAFGVPAPDGGLIAVALNRELGDFSDDDAELLELLRPHFAQAVAITGLLSEPLASVLRGPDGARLLTERQASIMRLVAAGHADRNIARALGISTRTVHAHLQNIYRALGVASRTEAIAQLRATPAAYAPAVSPSA